MLLFSACKKKEEETATKESMTGTLLLNVPSYLYKSRTYTFTASGITEPEVGVTYKWVATGFTPDTCFTQSVTFTTPDENGDYSITVIASYDDYYDKSAAQTVVIIDSLHFECLSDIIPGSNYIEDPRDGTIYHTRVYGDVEWFVQNLCWGGAGSVFSKIEALSTPFGRLYSWNEATSGVAGGETPGVAGAGLGKGPQGVCPPGWSVPTNEDWAHLATVVNGGVPLSFFDSWDHIADPLCAYAKLNGVNIWPYSPRNNKSNTAAWNGLPAGNSLNNGSNYANSRLYGFWLSSSEADADNGYYRYIHYDFDQVPYHHTDKRNFGASVRCVRIIVDEFIDE